MKHQLGFNLIVAFGTFSIGILPTAAQSQAFPTDAQIQGLMPNFQQQVENWQKQRRSSLSGIDSLRSFSSAWSKVAPDIAPFLGTWTAIEETQSIYPSTVRGRVCIFDTFAPTMSGNQSPRTAQDFGIEMNIGTFSNGKIRVDNKTLLIQKGDYLGSAFVINNKPGIYVYYLSGALKAPNDLPMFRNLPNSISSEIIQKFQAASCTASLPN